MALQLQKCRIERSVERELAANVAIAAEGVALVKVLEGGRAVVKPSAGAAGEEFAGFAYQQVTLSDTLPKMESLVVDDIAGGFKGVVLNKEPLPGTLRVVNAAGVALTAGDPSLNVGEYSITGSTVRVHASLDTTTISVIYKYSPSVAEFKSLFGDEFPGGPASNINGQVGCIEYGDVYTTEFDTTVDWAAATGVKLAANGQLTNQAGGGVQLNAQIIQIPVAGEAFLGLRVFPGVK